MADRHLALAKLDPLMGELIERHGKLSLEGRRRGPRPEPFGALITIVSAQQVSSSAAAAIDRRIEEAFGGRLPTAAQAVRGGKKLRAAGLSGRTVECLPWLARTVQSGELDLDDLESRSDAEVIARLTEVRGFGPWSAEMFLISYLERPDVLSGGDLGIRRGIQVALALEEAPSPDEAVEIGERWRPQRTLASFYLWRAASTASPT
ncbi:MAG: DNA-3-methyladenine glycosylase family protein [Solirubrobacterales bacterium]